MNPTDDWHAFDYELKYRLGELTLARQRIPVLRKVFRLPEIMRQAADPPLPPLAEGQRGYLLADVPRAGTAGAIGERSGLLHYCLKSYRRCYIDMAGDFAGYEAKFSAKTRSGLKRKLRKFAEHAGGLDFRRYATPQEIGEFFRLARPVSAASYQERLLDCGLPTEPAYEARAQEAAARDAVRAFVLCAQGVPVSYLYCPVHDGVLEYAYLGYTPDCARLSPGTVLQWLALESLFAEQRFAAFDFTEGESEHKLFFSTHQVDCSVELLLRRSAFGRFSASTHRGVDATSAWAGQTLDRLGLKRRMRQWLRRAA